MKYLIKNGQVIDPVNKINGVLDILVSDSKIERIEKNIDVKADQVIDAKNRIVAPGLIDMHTHLREPGREDKETIKSGTRAAIRGGFTSICCMPNTEPTIDNVNIVKSVLDIIKKDASCNVFVIGAITEGRSGKKLTDFQGLKKQGVAALSDDGASVDDDSLMSEALKESKKEGLLIIEHCEDTKLSAGGVVNMGFISTKMGLRGVSRESEYKRIARDIELARKAEARIHIAHVSCKESVEIIRKAKRAGVKVTAETAPHYISLTEECSATYDTNTKMNPPLRTKEDVSAMKEALRDGTLDVIATDHAPHTDAEKGVEFDLAPFGIIGLETALSIACMELVEKKILTWEDLIIKMSVNPARILGIGGASLKKGSAADIVIIDPAKEYIYKRDSIESKSKNSPFIDWKLRARASAVFVNGKLAVKDERCLL